MKDTEFTKVECIKGKIVSDNSEFFSMWGSRNPFLTIKEEVDNQISAKPNRAEMTISTVGGINSTITTWNDGNTISPEKMKILNHIGRTYSSGNGASICGVGQHEGLVAGRMNSMSSSTLTVESVFKKQKSVYRATANGYDNSFTTEYMTPITVIEKDYVMKKYEGMKRLTREDIDFVKALIGVKIYPYCIENELFKYIVNEEQVKPIDVLYSDVDDNSIRRWSKKFQIVYNDENFEIDVKMADISRYIKPNGTSLDETRANDWDKHWNLSTEGGGVFISLGGVNVILGGHDSWKLIDSKAHTTTNGINICINIPDGKLKTAVFSESANKSDVGTKNLIDICDSEGKVFEDMITEIKNVVLEWKTERTTITKSGSVDKEEFERILNDVFQNEVFMKMFDKTMSLLTEEQRSVLLTKKVKTIVKEYEKTYSENNTVEQNETSQYALKHNLNNDIFSSAIIV